MWTISYHGYYIHGYVDRGICRVDGPKGYKSSHASLDGAKQAIRKAIRRRENHG